jgi:hypothetical protein
MNDDKDNATQDAPQVWASFDCEGPEYLTRGKRYLVDHESNCLFEVVNDIGDISICAWKECAHLDGGNWTRHTSPAPMTNDNTPDATQAGKHTPGPWRVSSVGLTNDGKRAVTADDAGIAWVHPQTPFKRGDGWRHDCCEREANARLIAAAPDMLEALREARPYVPDHHGPVAYKVDAAIAKAEGKG